MASIDPEGTTKAWTMVVIPNRKVTISTLHSAAFRASHCAKSFRRTVPPSRDTSACRRRFQVSVQAVAVDQIKRPAPASLDEEVLDQVQGVIEADGGVRLPPLS